MSPQDRAHRSGAQRILDAAMLRFGERGFRGTTMKDIATEAGVSQALIVHHYGTKEDLRAACDEHVAHLIRERKEEAIGNKPQIDPFIALRQMSNSRVLLRYLTRALTEGGDHAAQLIDDMIADAEEYMIQGEQAGMIKPSAAPRDRVVVLVLWSLGALVLHEHAQRLLGVDFLAEDDSSADLQRYLYPALELYTQGLIADGAVDDLTAFLGPKDPTPNGQSDTRKE
jgi:AcrR family transcriptional regulator